MKIDIVRKYKVYYKCKFVYTNEFGEYVYDKVKWIKVMDAKEFIKLISELLTAEFFFSVASSEQNICIQHFDAMTGKSEVYLIQYNEVEEQKNET